MKTQKIWYLFDTVHTFFMSYEVSTVHMVGGVDVQTNHLGSNFF